MPLQRETVVRVALDVLDDVGLEGLTMRRLADRLGVQNPALYWHFANKQALLDQMAETLLADASANYPPLDAGLTWDTWLTRLAHAFRGAMLARRDGARLLASADLSGSALLVGFDRAIFVLREAGFGARDALVGVATLLDYTVGATFEEQAEPSRAAAPPDAGGRRSLPGTIDAARLPALADALAALGAESADETRAIGFAAGVDLIIAGLHARHATTQYAGSGSSSTGVASQSAGAGDMISSTIPFGSAKK